MSVTASPLTQARLAVLILALLFLAGCTPMWQRVRENERMFALDAARSHAGRGQCAAAIQSLDRAQARMDLAAYSRESTEVRARCYERLGMTEVARAHRRLIDDFYAEDPMAYPAADGSSVFQVKIVPTGGFEDPPEWLKIPSPRYTPSARRSKLVGRVVVSFELTSNDRTRAIRVLEMPHPLLASWAIEAVANAEPKKEDSDGKQALMPGGRFATTFVFEWHWAKEDSRQPVAH